MLDDIQNILSGLDKKIIDLRGFFDLDKKVKEICSIEEEISSPDFWKDQENANKVSRKLKALKDIRDDFLHMETHHKELTELVELTEDDEASSIKELYEEVNKLSKEVHAIEFKSMLNKKEDPLNAILSINAGAGGTESCDWANMLLRMYTKWAESNGFTIQVFDILGGEEAGIKNVTVIIKGAYVYGYLKGETGVHRLVRISPFDANSRRHTSFASVEVLPEITDDIDIEINPTDLRIDTYRSGGAGGQHVNVTDSAVRITHLPTGIVVQCQNERSQFKNKDSAMKVLRSRLYEHEMDKRKAEIDKVYEQKKRIEWGSQIRSYVLHPYYMVKDHRTNVQTSNADAVLDGELEMFIEGYLKS
ncbi:MAG: peptide chain release factor 2 [Candidatus Omnitrophica bacterium]|nr:peptide chain release factor 2 [Candidatus Omnitrophota bacterium]